MVICFCLISFLFLLFARSHRWSRSIFLLDLLFGGEDAAAYACRGPVQDGAAYMSPERFAPDAQARPRGACACRGPVQDGAPRPRGRAVDRQVRIRLTRHHSYAWYQQRKPSK
jgi:hypothetical protein